MKLLVCNKSVNFQKPVVFSYSRKFKINTLFTISSQEEFEINLIVLIFLQILLVIVEAI